MVRRPSLEQKRASEHSALSPFCLAALPAGRLGRLVCLPGMEQKEGTAETPRAKDRWDEMVSTSSTSWDWEATREVPASLERATPTGRKCSLKAFLVQEKRGGRAGRTRTTVARALWENPRPRFRGEFSPRGNGDYLIENKMIRLPGARRVCS